MKKTSLVKRLRAFTLLEMLLVIAVVGILASLAIQQYQKTALNQKNDKVVSQFQAIMQAATNYQLDQNGKWPVNSSEGYSNSDFVKNYLPNQNYKSAYGEKFQWHHSQENNGQPSPLFTVMLNNVPKNAAEQIANRLPNAHTFALNALPPLTPPCAAATCQVRAEIPSSGGINQPANIEGYCDAKKPLIKGNGWSCKTSPGSNTFTIGFTKSPCRGNEKTNLITALSELDLTSLVENQLQKVLYVLPKISLIVKPQDGGDQKWTVGADIGVYRYWFPARVPFGGEESSDEEKILITGGIGPRMHKNPLTKQYEVEKPEFIPSTNISNDIPKFQFSFKTICTTTP